MTDKKLTDEEIIKALECMLGMINNDVEYSINCRGCAFEDNTLCSEICSDGVAKAALELINRQKAEIERLKGFTIVNNIMESQRIKRETKAEAYKDFAEKLKVAAISCSIGGRYYKIFTTRDIDNFLKEMVGEEE